MAFAGLQADHELGCNEDGKSTGFTRHINDVEAVSVNNDSLNDKKNGTVSITATRTFEAPEWIRNLTPEERAAAEAALRKKIDLRLLPMVVLMYIMNYLDRNNIASARLAGLETDLNLDASGVQYSTAVSILFVGYLLMQVPSNLFLNKIGKPSLYLVCFSTIDI